ncbi:MULTISPECIES: MarR family winged helix-turn-helix transcriptional regulator [unclassified Sulfitobacter]|uniref:MarR family winged helix-turn-helix transcriptional regulator n=1 Tax=unclassified Sulfitobacter TaxID=196795 RepID=UPI0007C32B43|nr:MULTISPECIES: MarR family transcriptional regulator [unclassified Sulfitobacter]MAM25279.1 MarR family transcriptional regulator [Paracoccaceae bacterium]KZY05427.1 MarR family transcriptional regulator [Sulfitobacter sp. HI0023]KZY26056.1 MarR family transcriptional regulator [Sulfitobacter sp. HI0040]KZZ68085.1 MarR family transcriptional regulator [Sulfitobacter sp. HI0129]MBO28068.1 MarR family transcriptional regulator [Paracoccaceae bacterium]|tara:strand:- start:214 stop:696 length:483 start_codon:yes stop_codon:yes gene_type:complete
MSTPTPSNALPSKDRLRLWLRLLKLTRGIDAHLREKLRVEFATTLPRFDMLAALSRHPDGLKMSQLSGVLRVSNGNVTGIADRLAEEGLVERVPVPGDRRAMVLRLTRRGKTEFARQAQAHEAWIDTMLADVSAEDARYMAGKLAAIAAAAETKENAHAQ